MSVAIVGFGVSGLGFWGDSWELELFCIWDALGSCPLTRLDVGHWAFSTQHVGCSGHVVLVRSMHLKDLGHGGHLGHVGRGTRNMFPGARGSLNPKP